MKQKHLLWGILCMGLVFMMALAGCEQEYNGPSTTEISDMVWERSDFENFSSTFESLVQYGKLTVNKGIKAWGQTDAKYTLVVNTAERGGFSLPWLDNSTCNMEWEGDGNDDVKRTEGYVTFAEKSDGKSAVFTFTITNPITEKTIKGSLEVKTVFDASTVGIANINEFFEKILSYDLNDDSAKFATDKPITVWGQTDAAYSITAEVYSNYDYVTVYSPNSAPVLYNNGWWDDASVEWKPPVLGDVTASIIAGTYPGSGYGYPYIWVGGNEIYLYDYKGTAYALNTDSATAKSATFGFRITRDEQTISGTVTVNIKRGTKTAEQLEKERLENLRQSFDSSFSPSAYNNVVSKYIDKPITAFGQEDVLYTISVRGGDDYSDENGDYDTIYLPYATWTTKTAAATANVVVLDGSQLKVYQNKTGTAEFSFTYTYTPVGGTAKTVKGSVKVTVVK